MDVGLVAARLRESMLSWQDPSARRLRALRRARGAMSRRIVVATGLSAAAAGLVPYGGGWGLPDVGWTAGAAASAASAVLALRRVRRLEGEVPAPAMPRPVSAARPSVDRLGRAVGTLAALLAQLGPAAADTATDAAGAERSLRELATCVEAVEGALAVAPADTFAGLVQARALLLRRLEEGAAAYERLVAAAAECVAASAIGPGDAYARRRLAEATERLRGLAAGVAEAHAISRAVGV